MIEHARCYLIGSVFTALLLCKAVLAIKAKCPSVCQTRVTKRASIFHNSWICARYKFSSSSSSSSSSYYYYYYIDYYPSFPTRRICGGMTHYTWNFLLERKRRLSIDIRSQHLSRRPIKPSEKSSFNTNRKSTTRFPMSLRWTSYITPKTQNSLFFSKYALHLKKVCYIVFFVWILSTTEL